VVEELVGGRGGSIMGARVEEWVSGAMEVEG
jgi:hypothetical protein